MLFFLSVMSVSRIVFQFLMIRLVYTSVVSRQTGFYVNSNNQTVFHKIPDKKQLQFLKDEMMNLLEMPENIQQSSKPANQEMNSANRFLMEVYKIRGENEPKNPHGSENLEFFSANDVWKQTIKGSDLIMTFAARNRKKPGVQKTPKVKRLWFNVSGVSREDKITRGELKLFRSINQVKKENKGSIAIRVYRVTSDRDENGIRNETLVDAIDTAEDNGWVTLNITESLLYWVSGLGKNRGLFLEASTLRDRNKSIRLETLGIVGFVGVPEKEPFMVLYGSKTSPRKRRNFDYSLANEMMQFSDEEQIVSMPKSCERKFLYLNFKDLNMDSIIIAPKGYDAYYCHGLCDFPLSHNSNVTNHALIQALMNLKYPERAPKPCCAANRMSAIQVVYKKDDFSYISKLYHNMTVDSCGCQ